MSVQKTPPDGILLANGKPIANFLPKVIGAYRDVNITAGAVGPPQAIEIVFNLKGSCIEHSRIIPYQDLNKFDFEAEFPGCICSTADGRSTRNQIVRFIRTQLENMSGADMAGIYFPTSGWHFLTSGPRYINGSQIIGSKTDQPFWINPAVSNVQLISNPKEFIPDDVETLICAFRCAPDILLPVWAFTIYASLRSLLRKEGLPTACVLYLNGNQGFGKSETAKKFCALWRNSTSEFANVYDLHSTDASMRDAMADARDQIVVLDDICQSTNKTEQQKRRNIAASLARASSSGMPIARKHGNATETIECVASIVITGEFPFETASDLTRCVMVNIDRQLTGGNDSERIAAASALSGFLQWFSEHSEQELGRLRTEYHNFKTKERSNREERLQISLWELSWAFSSFLRFAVSIAAVSQRAAEKMDASLTVTLSKIFKATLVKLDKQKLRSLEALTTLIQAGVRGHAFPWFEHNGCLCVRTQDLTAFLSQASDNPTLSIKEVTANLRRKGLLLMDETGKSTRKINGIRVLTIPLEKLR